MWLGGLWELCEGYYSVCVDTCLCVCLRVCVSVLLCLCVFVSVGVCLCF